MYRRLASAVLVVLLGACTSGDADDGRTTVVASFFPLAELARAAGGPDVVVHDLTPPGVESHDYEPSTRDIDRIEDADLVVYLGDGFQPAIQRATRRAQQSLDALDHVRDRRSGDPHVWLDPTVMAELADVVAARLERPSPAAYKQQLLDLDAEYRRRLMPCRGRVLVTTHDAFGYLAHRYGLEPQPLTGLTPDAEPDPKRLAELADLVRARGVTTVFTEGTDEARAAESLAREAGVGTAVLRTLEMPTEDGYLGGMRANLDALARGLGC